MKRASLFLAFVAVSLPLSLEAKPVEQLLPEERTATKDTKMSFDIPQDDNDWSLTAGIIRLRPKPEDRLELSRKRGPSQVLGIRFTHQF